MNICVYTDHIQIKIPGFIEFRWTNHPAMDDEAQTRVVTSNGEQ
jgi:hypothetical protein